MESNDSLDDGDNDEFTSSSADDEEGKKCYPEQLLEGVASTDPISEYLKEIGSYPVDPGTEQDLAKQMREMQKQKEVSKAKPRLVVSTKRYTGRGV